MKNNRDDFLDATKRQAAGRVGYGCSFPGCKAITIGPSMENSHKTSITGVAAHICAAAERGPRYDASMSPEERKSVENCIWMCQTHARLIDTDEETYPTELLRQWKKDAEKRAAQALANKDYFSSYYESNGDNLLVLTGIFENFIFDGQYDTLRKLLDQYQTKLSDYYDEFITRFKIIYDVYCDRNELKTHLQEYCNLPCKVGSDDILKLFVAFDLADEAASIIEYCQDEEIEKCAKLLISGDLRKRIITPSSKTEKIELHIDQLTIINKLIASIFMTERIVNLSENEPTSTWASSEEFYFQVISAAQQINYNAVFMDEEASRKKNSEILAWLKENFSKIRCLDVTIQGPLWEIMLSAVTFDQKAFYKLYDECPEAIKGIPSVQVQKYVCQMETDISSVDEETILSVSESVGTYKVLLFYLSHIGKSEASWFLSNHQYLYSRDSRFLSFKLFCLKDMPEEDIPSFLQRYEEPYKEDFTFNCLMVLLGGDSGKKSQRIEWLRKKSDCTAFDNVGLYFEVLFQNCLWSDLATLYESPIPPDMKFDAACKLANCGNVAAIDLAQKLFQELIVGGDNRMWLRFNLGLLLRSKGHIQEAKKLFQEEYDRFPSQQALMAFMRMRYETGEYLDDSYLDALKQQIDSESQNLAAVFLMKLNNEIAAKTFFWRSLLLDENRQYSLNGLWQISMHSEKSTEQIVTENTVCVLSNGKTSRTIAIHSAEIMKGITPNGFAKCEHFSAEDPEVSSLMYCRKAEKVNFQGEEHVILSVESSDSFASKQFFATLEGKPGVTYIRASTPEGLMKEIAPILKASAESTTEAIESFNKMSLRMPFTSFSGVVGKNMLVALEFLMYGNTDKIRNNLAEPQSISSESVFVLSYDTFVFLACMGVQPADLANVKAVCSRQVQSCLIDDIGEELRQLSAKNCAGSLLYVKDTDGVAFFSPNTPDKQKKHLFLTRLKALAIAVKVDDTVQDYAPTDSDTREAIVKMFSDNKLLCEGGSLAVAKGTSKSILITDDQFVYYIAQVDKIANAGISFFISKAIRDPMRLITLSKEMKKMNFLNYLPFQYYKTIVDLILSREELLEEESDALTKWLLSDSEDGPSVQHEQVILSLFRQIDETNYYRYNPQNYLGDILFEILSRTKPTLFQKIVEETERELLDQNPE